MPDVLHSRPRWSSSIGQLFLETWSRQQWKGEKWRCLSLPGTTSVSMHPWTYRSSTRPQETVCVLLEGRFAPFLVPAESGTSHWESCPCGCPSLPASFRCPPHPRKRTQQRLDKAARRPKKVACPNSWSHEDIWNCELLVCRLRR